MSAFLDLNMIVCIKEAFGRQSRLDEVIRVWPLRWDLCPYKKRVSAIWPWSTV